MRGLWLLDHGDYKVDSLSVCANIKESGPWPQPF